MDVPGVVLQNEKGGPPQTVFWTPTMAFSADDPEKAVKVNKKPPGCLDDFQEFTQNTTLHGIRYITDGNLNWFRRLVWFLVLISINIWLGYGLINGVRKFLEFRIGTVTTVNYETNLRFPVVTFCNFNQWRTSIIGDDPYTYEILTGIAFPDSPINWEQYDILSQNYTWNITQTALDTGHQIEEMLLQCIWQSGQLCTASDFKQIITDFGVCYSFNNPDNDSDVLMTSQAGTSAGLHMVLDVQQTDYTYGDYAGAGFKMLLHHQRERPLVRQLGISISPGFESSVAVRLHRAINLPRPYETKCEDKKLKYSQTYTRALCMYECEIDYVISVCGCKDYRYPGNALPCPPKELILCALPAKRNFSSSGVTCDCPVPCDIHAYETKISTAAWPSNFYVDMFVSLHNSTEYFVRSNYLEVYVYFEEISSEEIKQVPDYDLLSFQSDVGGYMGLLCGASMITLAEFLDFALIACCGWICRKKR